MYVLIVLFHENMSWKVFREIFVLFRIFSCYRYLTKLFPLLLTQPSPAIALFICPTLTSILALHLLTPCPTLTPVLPNPWPTFSPAFSLILYQILTPMALALFLAQPKTQPVPNPYPLIPLPCYPTYFIKINVF